MPKPTVVIRPHSGEPLEDALDDIRVLLEARRAEYQSASDRIRDILLTLTPRPRIGRPPKR